MSTDKKPQQPVELVPCFPLYHIPLGATQRSRLTLIFYYVIRISRGFMLDLFQEGKRNKLLIGVKISSKP